MGWIWQERLTFSFIYRRFWYFFMISISSLLWIFDFFTVETQSKGRLQPLRSGPNNEIFDYYWIENVVFFLMLAKVIYKGDFWPYLVALNGDYFNSNPLALFCSNSDPNERRFKQLPLMCPLFQSSLSGISTIALVSCTAYLVSKTCCKAWLRLIKLKIRKSFPKSNFESDRFFNLWKA